MFYENVQELITDTEKTIDIFISKIEKQLIAFIKNASSGDNLLDIKGYIIEFSNEALSFYNENIKEGVDWVITEGEDKTPELIRKKRELDSLLTIIRSEKNKVFTSEINLSTLIKDALFNLRRLIEHYNTVVSTLESSNKDRNISLKAIESKTLYLVGDNKFHISTSERTSTINALKRSSANINLSIRRLSKIREESKTKRDEKLTAIEEKHAPKFKALQDEIFSTSGNKIPNMPTIELAEFFLSFLEEYPSIFDKTISPNFTKLYEDGNKYRYKRRGKKLRIIFTFLDRNTLEIDYIGYRKDAY